MKNYKLKQGMCIEYSLACMGIFKTSKGMKKKTLKIEKWKNISTFSSSKYLLLLSFPGFLPLNISVLLQLL